MNSVHENFLYDLGKLPNEDQLDILHDLVGSLIGISQAERSFWSVKYGLSTSEACLASFMNRFAGTVLTKDQLFRALYPIPGDETNPKIIDVFVCKLRAKGLEIETTWGVGYSLPEMITIEEIKIPMAARMILERARARFDWDAQEDSELLRMFDSKSGWWAIAEELERSERACQERVRKLRGSLKR